MIGGNRSRMRSQLSHGPMEKKYDASDVMVRNVITIGPQALVSEAAKLLTENDISALPVVNEQGDVVGIISEADLMRREEIGTERSITAGSRLLCPRRCLPMNSHIRTA